jgi:hypothetical protein
MDWRQLLYEYLTVAISFLLLFVELRRKLRKATAKGLSAILLDWGIYKTTFLMPFCLIVILCRRDFSLVVCPFYGIRRFLLRSLRCALPIPDIVARTACATFIGNGILVQISRSLLLKLVLFIIDSPPPLFI